MLLNSVQIYLKIHKVEPSQPTQCSKCYSFKHHAEKCSLKRKCVRCAVSHPVEKCDEPKVKKCRNFDGKSLLAPGYVLQHIVIAPTDTSPQQKPDTALPRGCTKQVTELCNLFFRE